MNFQVNNETQIVEIEVKSRQILIVENGEITAIDPPSSGFGDQLIVWINGAVDRVENKEIKKIQRSKQ
nr:DUF3954 domain-containing protein [Halalkalibacter wakoensis]